MHLIKKDKKKLPLVVLTSGEPAGIGVDVCLQIAVYDFAARIVVVGDITLLQERALMLGLNISFIQVTDIQKASKHKKNQLYVYNIRVAEKVEVGILNVKNSSYVLNCLDFAIQVCQEKKADVMVTSAVHKGIICEYGVNFSGHTEYLADATGKTPVMMLAGHTLKVALLTTHLPLKNVSQNINTNMIVKKIRIIHTDLGALYKIKNPKILLSGLNPHSGEDGKLGTEEQEHFYPAIKILQKEGIDVTGPLPADSMFSPQNIHKSDVFVCAYHDQGLSVLKTIDFSRSYNVTLGLGFLRVSCDHGTVLNLAGSGKSNPNSLKEAIYFAIDSV
jgi:4-hydroxythreonine-4-phosphate dehydrogenase